MRKKVVLSLIALVAVAALFIASAAPSDVESLRASLDRFRTWHAANPVLVAVSFFVTYVVMTALSLPVAIWMTLGAGALFGFGPALLLVSFASSIGATLAFLAARYLLRDRVQRRFGSRLRVVNDGIERDGALYLFTLRVLPGFPFVLINLLMALTPIRTLTFYAVSQIGMLPGTMVAVNAGTELSRIESVYDLASAPLIASLALLAFFPWFARLVITFVRQKSVYSGWNRPKSFDRNLVVIGAGSAGLVAAYIGAAVKAKVTLVESHRMGGDCLNTGCVPSKAILRAAGLAHLIRNADAFGLTPVTPEIRFAQVFDRIRKVIARIEPHDSVERYRSLGVDVRQGHARLVDPWTVEIESGGSTERLTTRAIVIATGAEPQIPAIPGLAEVEFLTSETLWDAMAARDRPPGRLVVLGGGPIGCELAQAFARLGSSVTLIERLPRLLASEDPEASSLLRATLEAEGVAVLSGHRAIACHRKDGSNWIEVAAGDAVRQMPFDDILVCTGRKARLAGYGLEELGIATGATIATNEYLQTRFPNILAAGDVAGPFQFTHTASHQAWFAAVNALFGRFKRFRADYRVIPRAVFTDPELARVGLTEAEARASGIAFEVTRYGLDDLDRAITDGAARGFVKVLTPPGRDTILGVTIVGEAAAELLAEFTFAMKHGHGLGRILSTVHIYPTLGEANRNVAGAWRRGHVNSRLLALLERFHLWQRGA